MHPVLEKLKKDKIEKIKLGIFDVDGVMRGKYINLKKQRSILVKEYTSAIKSQPFQIPYYQ